MTILQEILFVKLAASAVLVVALLATVALRRRSAALRGRVLTLALILALVLPLLTTVLPSPVAESRVAEPLLTVVAESDGAETDPEGRSPAEPGLRGGGNPVSDGLAAMLLLWPLGVIVGMGRLFRSHRQAHRLVAEATPVQDVELLERYRVVRSGCGGLPPVPLLWSSATESPLTIGLLRPRIVLPAAAVDWPEAMVELVLRHELAHVERRDNLVGLAGALVAVLHWFDPLAWLVLTRLRREAEIACDDRVVIGGARASAYARVLLTQAHATSTRRPVLAPAASFACHAQRRFEMLLDPGTDRRRRSGRATLWVASLLLLVVFSLTPLRPAVQPGVAAMSARESTASRAPEWWQEMVRELREMRAVLAWKRDPELGTPLPEGPTRLAGSDWTVEAHDAIALEGVKYGVVFSSTEGYIRISRPREGGLDHFGVNAAVHPQVDGFERAMDDFLNVFGLGYEGDFRAYRIDYLIRPGQIDELCAVVAAMAAQLRAEGVIHSTEDRP